MRAKITNKLYYSIHMKETKFRCPRNAYIATGNSAGNRQVATDKSVFSHLLPLFLFSHPLPPHTKDHYSATWSPACHMFRSITLTSSFRGNLIALETEGDARFLFVYKSDGLRGIYMLGFHRSELERNAGVFFQDVSDASVTSSDKLAIL